jgi:acetamidase/formamidase
VIVRKDLGLTFPRAETPTHRITMGMDPSLDNAASHALRQLIDWVASTTELTRQQAFMLMSLAADVHVTQLVNEHKGIHVMLPKSTLSTAA